MKKGSKIEVLLLFLQALGLIFALLLSDTLLQIGLLILALIILGIGQLKFFRK